jgi:hypothetical protein
MQVKVLQLQRGHRLPEPGQVSSVDTVVVFISLIKN